MNPYLSLYSTSNLREKIRDLEGLWEDFVSSNKPPERLRRFIYDSWKRCQDFGVDPSKKQTTLSFGDIELKELINHSRFYKAALPILDNVSKRIVETNHLTTLCDHEGRIIYLNGDYGILNRAELMNFLAGADWSEKAVGTNAIGTSLAMEQPIQILSAEHFCEGCHPWICSSAPIKDPCTGQLLGTIDLTAQAVDAQPHALEIAIMAADLIQKQLESTSFSTLEYLRRHFSEVSRRKMGQAMILFDVSLHVIDGTQKALNLLNIRSWHQLSSVSGIKQLRDILIHNFQVSGELFLDQLNFTAYIEVIPFHLERAGFLVSLYPAQSKDMIPLSHTRFCTHKEWSVVIGKSEKILTTIQKAQLIAPTQVSVLLTGESGTGKELIAKTIHKTSDRAANPFLAINCGSFPKELISSELFGYEGGTFTGGNTKGKKGKFEEANGGTLFLDEIGEMPLDLQVYLLRVLQEKEVVRLGGVRPIPVDVRIIAATHQNIPCLIQEGNFRADLYYRLNVVELPIPPLRERQGDILLLTQHFLEELCKKYKKPLLSLNKEVVSYFTTYAWPGNIRELENAIEHAVLFCMTDQITLTNLPRSMLEKNNICQLSFTKPRRNEEMDLIMRYIHESDGNLSEVARRLNVARTTLYRKMGKYGISK